MSKIDWSKAPEDATHAGVARGGLICWYKDVDSHKYFYVYQGESEWSVGAGGSPSHQPLERRPEDKWDGPSRMISGNTLKWHKLEPQWVPGGLPPVGTECEFRAKDGSLNNGNQTKWLRCEVIATTRAYAILRHIGRGYTDNHECSHSLSRIEFRPTQSHRDKVMEAAEQHIPVRLAHKTKYLRVIFSDLYDYGMLKLPEGE